MAALSDKLSSLTFVPLPQSPARAGFLQDYAGTTAPENWYLLDKDADTTIVDCETLYPNLWANANVNWRSGSDLVIPVSSGMYSSLKTWVPTITGNGSGLSASTLEYATYKFNNNSMVVNCAVTSVTVPDASITEIYVSIPTGFTIPTTAKRAVNAAWAKDDAVYDVAYVQTNGASQTDKIMVRPSQGNWSNTSAFKFQLEFPLDATNNLGHSTIIKLYDDASNIAMSLKDATASLTGAVRLSSDFAASASDYGFVKKDISRLDTYNLTLGSNVTSTSDSLGSIRTSHTVSASDAGLLRVTLYSNMQGGKGEFTVYKNAASVQLIDGGVAYDGNSYSSVRSYTGEFIEGDIIELYFFRNSVGGTSTGYAGSGIMVETITNHYIG